MMYNAKDYLCVCGKRGVYLNLLYPKHKSPAMCEKCCDELRKNSKKLATK